MGTNDLSGLKRLTTSNGQDEQPNLSPDGRRVAFVSNRSGTFRLWTMDSTGASQVALATGSESYIPEAAPAWSPDGTQIAFTSVRTGLSQVFVVSSAGGTPVQLSHEMNGAFNPAWSADGTTIYFVSVVGAPSLHAVTVATNKTSDWVYDGVGIGQPACSTSGCFAVEGAYGNNGDIVSIGKDASTTVIVGTAANETSPTVLVP
jgi:TolB protein